MLHATFNSSSSARHYIPHCILWGVQNYCDTILCVSGATSCIGFLPRQRSLLASYATCHMPNWAVLPPPPPFRSPSIRQLVMRVQEQQRCLLRRLPAFGTFNRIQQPPCAGACPLYLSVCVCVSVCLHLSATRNCLFKGFHTHTHTLAHMCLVLFRYVTFLLLFLLFPCFPARSGILSPTHLGRLLCLSTFAIFFCFCFYFSFLYSTPCLFLFNWCISIRALSSSST